MFWPGRPSLLDPVLRILLKKFPVRMACDDSMIGAPAAAAMPMRKSYYFFQLKAVKCMQKISSEEAAAREMDVVGVQTKYIVNMATFYSSHLLERAAHMDPDRHPCVLSVTNNRFYIGNMARDWVL